MELTDLNKFRDEFFELNNRAQMLVDILKEYQNIPYPRKKVKENRWICVIESLPKVCNTQLLRLEDGTISTGYLSQRRPSCEWCVHDPEGSRFRVTHWMNLPEEP